MKNRIIEHSDCISILDKKNNAFLIDKEDLSKVLEYHNWFLYNGVPVALVNIGDRKYRRVYLRNVILDSISSRKKVYHFNNNKFDNRKGNISYTANNFIIRGDVAEMTFHNKLEAALVDTSLIEEIKKYSWSIGTRGYVMRMEYENGLYKKVILLHRIIVEPPDNMEVDHKDNNRLNNLKSNLRICTGSENGRNKKKYNNNSSSVYKGASWSTRDKNWVCVLSVGKKKFINIGSFNNEIACAHAYNFYAHYYHEEFASVNENLPPSDSWFLERVKGKRVSVFKGVSYQSKSNKWISSIFNKGKLKYLKKYDYEIEAALRYNEEAIKMNIPFYKLNIISNAHLDEIKLLGENDYKDEFKLIQEKEKKNA